jgi:hypothetical protein
MNGSPPARVGFSFGYQRANNWPDSGALQPGYPQWLRVMVCPDPARYHQRMKVTVYPRRRNGRPLQDRGQEGVTGDLQMSGVMHGSETYKSVALRGKNDPRGAFGKDVLPPLFEPELVTLGNEAMLLRGYESSGGAAYVQEWYIKFEDR